MRIKIRNSGAQKEETNILLIHYAGGGDEDQGQDDMEVEETDAFDFADPVDITAKLPGNFYELLASKKWQERREMLDALLEKAKIPKILDKDYTELITALAKVRFFTT
jgi:cytoskeleton-associated protein 5